MIRKAHRLNGDLGDQLFRDFAARQDQVQCVAADVCRTSDVLTQTVELLGEHVDGVRVELAGDDRWHVEFADDYYKNLY